MVGSLDTDQEAMYAQFLAPYFLDPENLFVISSDFCHWGDRFNYTYYDKKEGEIHQSIEKLDKMVSAVWIRLDIQSSMFLMPSLRYFST